jgi:hypothetical protein
MLKAKNNFKIINKIIKKWFNLKEKTLINNSIINNKIWNKILLF